ncbi:MAG: prolyl oligopeptidase family serine peptidase [Acidobacteriota bacterium]
MKPSQHRSQHSALAPQQPRWTAHAAIGTLIALFLLVLCLGFVLGWNASAAEADELQQAPETRQSSAGQAPELGRKSEASEERAETSENNIRFVSRAAAPEPPPGGGEPLPPAVSTSLRRLIYPEEFEGGEGASDPAAARRFVHLAASKAFRPAWAPGDADPTARRWDLSDTLHRFVDWMDLDPGEHQLKVPVGHDQERYIALRLPPDYDPARPWPLLILYHYSGGTGREFLGYAQRLLGQERADQFVLAAPTFYRQTTLDAPPPYTAEHPLMLRALRQVAHVDSDRVYTLGVSLGGYTTWTLAKVHADRYASAVSISAVYDPVADVEGMWELMAPNAAHIPVLHAWGYHDRFPVRGFQGEGPNAGTMRELNRRFSPLIEDLGLQVLEYRDGRSGHTGVLPPGKMLDEIFAHRRVHAPRQVRHHFRHLHQARAYWLEGLAWHGDAWTGRRPAEPKIDPKTGKKETQGQAYARVYLPLLGLLEGHIEGQTIQVESLHLDDLIVWFGEDSIDWSQPVTLMHRGRTVFTGLLQPDPLVAITQARRSLDFDRLRWAGLRLQNVESGEISVSLVDVDTDLPVVPGAG